MITPVKLNYVSLLTRIKYNQCLGVRKEKAASNFETAFRAEDGTQTRDPQLGRLMLYRLSYFRIAIGVGKDGFEPPKA